jgi:hypothetical protein
MSATALIGFDAEPTRSDRVSSAWADLAPRVETYSYILSQPLIAGMFPLIPPLPLFTIVVDGVIRYLSRPLILRTAIEDGQFFVENDTLQLFGHGATMMDAMQAFSRDLIYYWRYYRSLSNDEVAGHGAVLKRLYEDLVVA